MLHNTDHRCPPVQLEGMERPKTKGKGHSYVELEEDENVVEKYTKAMEAITSAIQLDKLKQVGPLDLCK